MNKIIAHPSSPNWYLSTVRLKLLDLEYRPETIRAYLGQLKLALKYFRGTDPGEITADQIRRYLEFLAQRKRSRSTVDQAVNALGVFSKEIFGRALKLGRLERPRKKKAEPVVLSPEEVHRISDATHNLKRRLMIELAYWAGLRVSEVVGVKAEHLNLEKRLLLIPPEGRIELRTSAFPETLTDGLARLIEGKRPEDYVFANERGGKLTTRFVAKCFKNALKSSGVDKPATPHTLRHSFAIAMKNNGTDPETLKVLLGHSRPNRRNPHPRINLAGRG